MTGTLWDVGLGSLASLVAAALTFAAGKLLRSPLFGPAVGGIFPVLVNAFVVPLVLTWSGFAYAGYWFMFASLLVTQAVWVYGLGLPLYYAVRALRARGVSAFCGEPGKPLRASSKN